MTTSMRVAHVESELHDLLCFDLGAERFAMPLAAVEEIVDAGDIAAARNTSGALGVLRVRGEVLPVYDATHVLQSARTNAQPLALILPSASAFVAILVDGAEAAPRVSLDGLRTPPALISTDRVLDGVLRVGVRWVGLINASAFVDALTNNLDLASRSGAGRHGR